MGEVKRVVLFDLDGCLIDDRWRRHLCDWVNRRFEKYHEAIKDDTKYLPIMASILQGHIDDGDDIYFTTARPEYSRGASLVQLKQFFSIDSLLRHQLMMRGEDEEGIPSAELKREMLKKIRDCYPSGTHITAYDDHGDVCVMYHSEGVQQVYLANDRIILDMNMKGSPQIARDIREGKSIIQRMYSLRDQCLYLTDVNLSRVDTVVQQFFSQRGDEGSMKSGLLKCIGDKEIEKERHENLKKLSEQYKEIGGAFPEFSKINPVINLDHVSINSDEKERNDELIKDVQKGWLSPDVANLPRILEMSSQTFSDRREIYGDSSDQFGRIMEIMMENANFSPSTAKEYEMMMFFNHVVGKLVRFANSGLEHIDSIHDVINYAGLVECCVIGADRELKEVSDEG